MRPPRLRDSFRAVSLGMKSSNNSSPVRRHVWSVLLLTLLIAAHARAADLSLQARTPARMLHLGDMSHYKDRAMGSQPPNRS